MNTYQKLMSVSELCNGMFVCKLPIPWSETPFPLQGFFIRSEEDRDELGKYCHSVYIDTIRSKNTNPSRATTNKKKLTQSNDNKQTCETGAKICTNTNYKLSQIRVKPILFETGVYVKNKPINREIKTARRIHKKILNSIPGIIEKIETVDKKHLNIIKVEAHNLVESAIRNPHALIWLTKLENSRKDIFQYALNSSIWGLIFGRHLGLDKEALSDLTLSLLLSKIGFITRKPHPDENTETEDNFVSKGVKILKDSAQFNSRILTTIQTHQERFDGTGGPKGIMGDKIPCLGKIAGIADYYESLTNPINDKTPLISSAAMTLIYSLSNRQFQQDLVEEFIKAIGIYPTGTLVELSNKEVGYVLENEENSKLSPKIMLILDQNKKRFKRPKICNLSDSQSPIIKCSLPYGTYNLDISNFKPSCSQGLFS